MKTSADPAATRAAVLAVEAWIRDPDATSRPSRAALADAVRLTARTLEHLAPGTPWRCESLPSWLCNASTAPATRAAHRPML